MQVDESQARQFEASFQSVLQSMLRLKNSKADMFDLDSATEPLKRLVRAWLEADFQAPVPDESVNVLVSTVQHRIRETYTFAVTKSLEAVGKSTKPSGRIRRC